MSSGGPSTGAQGANGAGVPDGGTPAPEFSVVSAEAVKYAAAPTLKFALQAEDASGHEVFMVALVVQIHLDPVRRDYDDETRARLVELFGEPGRWAATTHSFQWAQVDVVVPAFTGTTTFEVPLACTFDLELAAAKYLYSLPSGAAPLSFHFSGSVFYRADDGRVQIVQIPWDRRAQFDFPVATWREMIDSYYPHSGWIALHRDTLDALASHKAERALPSFDACIAQLLEQEQS